MAGKQRWFWALVVGAQLSTACLGSSSGDPKSPVSSVGQSEMPTAGSVSDVTSPQSAVADSASGADMPDDLCDTQPVVHSYLVEIGLLKEKDLANLPVPYDFQTEGYWTVGPLGSEGAQKVGASLSGRWLCDLEVDPGVGAALAGVADNPDGVGAADDLVWIIEGDPNDSSTPDPSGDSGGVAIVTADELRQQSRDALAAAAVAELLGWDEQARRLKADALDYFGAYAELTLDRSTDPAELAGLAAAADLLGMDEMGAQARDKLIGLLEKELADAASLFSICTTDEHVVKIYATAVQRAHAVYGASTSTLTAWIDIQRRRQRGERVPECEGGTWEARWPIEGWDGEVVVHLESCGWSEWSGSMTSVGSLAAEGGVMTQFSETPLEFTLVDAKALPTFVLPWELGRPGSSIIDIEPVVEITMTADGATGQGTAAMSGSAIFEMDAYAESATATFHFGPGQLDLVISAAGMTFHQSRAINWADQELSAPIEKAAGNCNPAG